MMDTFGIPAAFVIVAGLSLWVVIGSKGWWIFKLTTVAATTFFSVVLWNSLGTLQGWPTKETLPEKFEIKWIVVEEPNKRTNDPGRIHVWQKNMTKEYESNILVLHNKGKNQEPRLHELPYTREMHQQAQHIQQKIAKGEKFFAEMKNGKMKGDGKGKGKGKGEGEGDGEGEGKYGGKDGGSLSQEQDPIFHELPPPHFIPKE